MTTMTEDNGNRENRNTELVLELNRIATPTSPAFNQGDTGAVKGKYDGVIHRERLDLYRGC